MNDGRPCKIVHVPRRFVAGEWGGTETVVLEVSRQQQRAGGDPLIVTSMALADRRREEIGGVPVRRHPYCYPFLGLSAADRAALDKKGGNLLSLGLFLGLLREPGVRLFHAHALKRLGGEVRTAARWRRKPLVVSLHGGVFDVPAAELGTMLKPIERKLEWGRPFGALFGSRRVLEDADQVICVGRSELERARQELTHDRVAYLPNGVDCAKFSRPDGAAFRVRHGIPPDAFLVLTLSRIDAQKNQRLLLEALVRSELADAGVRLLLIGPETQPDYAAGLRQFILEHGLQDRVRMLPGLRNDSPDLVNAYGAADLFVLPSIHEPFGIVVLEAWSAGLPVVASRVGGLQALIRDGETGRFFDPNAAAAADDLAALIARLATDPEGRRRLGEAGREEARTQYDWVRIHEQLEALYRRAEEHARWRHGGGRGGKGAAA
ncbi:MAG: glycosyltransferase family 4 protein [Verrucomicrobiales bacterium]|nr:glycosyltransferase family 4 protein [Verrucomicrobiales bacterium]MCP5526679.1 glycosyltransferase family 4 protein [Verrucomicrobiales bacterium]